MSLAIFILSLITQKEPRTEHTQNISALQHHLPDKYKHTGPIRQAVEGKMTEGGTFYHVFITCFTSPLRSMIIHQIQC